MSENPWLPQLSGDPTETVELDPAEHITAQLMIRRPADASPKVVVAFHDPQRTEPGIDDEIYCVTIGPDSAWYFGSALIRFAQHAR